MKLGILTNIKESYDELRYKTSWPTQTQLIKSACIVLIASVIISIIILIMDIVVNWFMHSVYSLA
ncbi:MAG: preprotein translocase subunit SecE [Muribaculaceae bacterium]|nr:preprotein translocase subunit SecE [Muribaculaceae bacterium]